MNDHKVKPLPEASYFPHGLVQITVWTEIDTQYWSGRNFTNFKDQWRNVRDFADILDNDLKYDWSFDGFNFNYFNRAYFKDHETDPLVNLALWALERWAKDNGFDIGNRRVPILHE